MPTFTDPRALVRHQKQRVEKVRRSIESSSGDVADFSKKEAIKLTSGTKTTQELRRAGHPYAKRRKLEARTGKGKGGAAATFATFPLLPVNAQTKRIQKGFRIFRRRQGKDFIWITQNIEPHSKFALRPGGTKFVRDRMFWAELRRRTERYARRHVVKAWRDAHRS